MRNINCHSEDGEIFLEAATRCGVAIACKAVAAATGDNRHQVDSQRTLQALESDWHRKL
jgi:hypothetical protein